VRGASVTQAANSADAARAYRKSRAETRTAQKIRRFHRSILWFHYSINVRLHCIDSKMGPEFLSARPYTS
jgi:hypothetical protein